MFARYFVEFPFPSDDVERIFASAPATWLPLLASEANHRGDRLLAEVGFGEDVRIARTVEIELGDPIRLPTKTVMPLRWRATGVAGLFPSMDADLEIAALGRDRCQLSMSARYEPPWRAVGRAIDQAALFRVAEATIKDFLDRVRDGIARALGPVSDDVHADVDR
jgi:hypothetical protein